MIFRNWVIDNYADRTDSFGMFAREVGQAKGFPETDNLRELRDYVQHRMGLLDVFNRLWNCYQRDLRNGAAEDELFKNEYQEIFKLVWQTMKRAMRTDNKDERLEIWETGRDYYINHMCNGVPDFSAKLLDLVKDELIREEPELDVGDLVG